MKRTRVLIVGVGGQGVLTAARWLGDAVARSGQEVCIGQIHGMSQRGGSVESSVVIGPGETATIGPAAADVIVALEPLEAARALSRASARTVVVLADDPIVPWSVTRTGGAYPDVGALVDDVRAVAPKVTVIASAPLVQELGEKRMLNVLMLGAASAVAHLGVDPARLVGAIEGDAPAEHRPRLRRAFELGRRAATGMQTAPRGAG